MSATRCLREEHDVILKVLGFFDQALEIATEKNEVTLSAFGPFLQFFEGFADHCHHCKEESRLFPALEEAGMPSRQGPIAVMLQEHQQGRALVRHMKSHVEAADGGEQAATHEVLEAGRRFTALLFGHIQKENQVLFNMADGMLQGAAAGDVLDGYLEEEADPSYGQTYSDCSQIVRELAEIYGKSREEESPLRVL